MLLTIPCKCLSAFPYLASISSPPSPSRLLARQWLPPLSYSLPSRTGESWNWTCEGGRIGGQPIGFGCIRIVSYTTKWKISTRNQYGVTRIHVYNCLCIYIYIQIFAYIESSVTRKIDLQFLVAWWLCVRAAEVSDVTFLDTCCMDTRRRLDPTSKQIKYFITYAGYFLSGRLYQYGAAIYRDTYS